MDLTEITSKAKFELGELVRRNGLYCFAVFHRYYRKSTGQILYDIREFGSKPGHREAIETAVPQEELTTFWTSDSRKP